MSQVLLVAHEKGMLSILTKFLRTEGYKVDVASDMLTAKSSLKSGTYQLVVYGAGGWDADLELLTMQAGLNPKPAVICIVEKDDPAVLKAVSGFRPFACIEKPIKIDEFLAHVQKAVDYSDEALTKNVNLNLQLETCHQFESVVAVSSVMKNACDMLSRVMATDVSIFLVGEAGTGRATVARSIHANSRRKEQPQIEVDCQKPDVEKDLFGCVGAEGALLRANAGTLILMDVDRLSFPLQARLFDALQSRRAVSVETDGKVVEIDLRVISTASPAIERMVAEGAFNPSLYRFLRVISVVIPPLRQRKEDIVPTLRFLMQRRLTPNQALPIFETEAIKAFERYEWPGNVNEMEQVLDYVLRDIKNGKVTLQDIPRHVQKKSDTKAT